MCSHNCVFRILNRNTAALFFKLSNVFTLEAVLVDVAGLRRLGGALGLNLCLQLCLGWAVGCGRGEQGLRCGGDSWVRPR